MKKVVQIILLWGVLSGCVQVQRQQEGKSFSQAFFRDSLDMGKLYESGQWDEMMTTWIDSFAAKDSLVEESKQLLERTAKESPFVLKPLVRALCRILYSKGAVQPAATLAAYPYGIDASDSPVIAQRLLVSTLLPGKQAPKIQGLRYDQQRYEGTILLFYETACRSCQQIINTLTVKYDELSNKRIRIISISTDIRQKEYLEYAIKFPWVDVLCDYRSFNGPNVINYGVAATPILFLIDKKGMVIDQYGSVEEIFSQLQII